MAGRLRWTFGFDYGWTAANISGVAKKVFSL